MRYSEDQLREYTANLNTYLLETNNGNLVDPKVILDTDPLEPTQYAINVRWNGKETNSTRTSSIYYDSSDESVNVVCGGMKTTDTMEQAIEIIKLRYKQDLIDYK